MTLNFDIRPLSVGEIFSRSFLLYRDNFLTLGFISWLVLVPYGLLVGLGMTESVYYYSAIAGLLIFGPCSNMMVVDAIVHAYRDQPVSMEASYRAVRPILVPLVGTFLLAFFFTGLGLLALIIPGVWFSVWFGLIIPVMIVEGRFWLDAMKRSGALVKGAFWRTLLLISAAALPSLLLVRALAQFWRDYVLDRPILNVVVPILASVIEGVTIPFLSAVVVVYYFDRRSRENLDSQFLTETMRGSGPAAAPVT
jgi:hypothetical protein